MDKIEFNCSRCGTHFTVNAKMAGKTGRCKRCQHRMKIPKRRSESGDVAVSGRFHLGAVAAATAALETGEEASSAYVVNTQADLAAVSERLIHHPGLKEPEEAESGPYLMNRHQVKAIKKRKKRKSRKSKPPGLGKRIYWKQTHGLLSLLSRLNDFAYLISLPFLLLVLMGILIPSRQLAVIGAAGVILPNIGRFAVNGFYLVVLPFRHGPLQGILFFIPPFTFYYLYKRWPRMKEATIQFLSPAIPIVCVVLAFTFVPWLRSGDVPEGASLEDRIRSETATLRTDIEQQIDDARQQVRDFSNDPDVQDFADDVQQGLKDVTTDVKEKLEDIQQDVLEDSDSTGN